MNMLPLATICDDFPMRALLVSPDMSLDAVLDRSLQESGKRLIFLVDREGALVGMIDPVELHFWGRLHLGLMATASSLTERKFRRLAKAQVAADLILPQSQMIAISQEATIGDALDKMTAFNLEAVAVVDGNGRVINDLHLVELLTFARRKSENTAYA